MALGAVGAAFLAATGLVTVPAVIGLAIYTGTVNIVKAEQMFRDFMPGNLALAGLQLLPRPPVPGRAHRPDRLSDLPDQLIGQLPRPAVAGQPGLRLPQAVTEALREHRVRQEEERVAVGGLWSEHNLVFTTAVGTELDAANVRRSFRSICKAAGVGEDWTPRELRTSFVSLLSASGVPVEEIARLVGHSSSRTTETIYRKELRPVLVKGAEVMDQIFG